LPKCDFGLPAPERYIDKGRFLAFLAFLGQWRVIAWVKRFAPAVL
jgi:hypothetical protein